MKKIHFEFISSVIVLVCIIIVTSPAIATDVGGIIDTDTVWGLAGSPYNLISTVQVAEGVRLTIEPGVEVNRGQDSVTIELWGSLFAVGTSSSKIHFNEITLLAKDYSMSMEIKYAVFAPYNQYGFYPQIYGRNFKLNNSELHKTDVYIWGSNSHVEKNIFIDSRVIHHHIRSENVFVRNNDFYQPEGYHSIYMDVSLKYTKPVIQHNHFHDSSIIHFVLTPSSQGDCVATNNYWDTIDPSGIESMIYDRKDDLNINGYVIFKPYLTKPWQPIAMPWIPLLLLD